MTESIGPRNLFSTPGPPASYKDGLEAKRSEANVPEKAKQIVWGGDVNTSRTVYGSKTTKETGR